MASYLVQVLRGTVAWPNARPNQGAKPLHLEKKMAIANYGLQRGRRQPGKASKRVLKKKHFLRPHQESLDHRGTTLRLTRAVEKSLVCYWLEKFLEMQQ
jgi:hypothetical protein